MSLMELVWRYVNPDTQVAISVNLSGSNAVSMELGIDKMWTYQRLLVGHGLSV